MVLPDWPSVLQAMRQGDADIVLTASITAERLRYMDFTLGTVGVPAAVIGLRSQPVERHR